MNRHLTLVAVLCLACMYTNAQKNNPLINSAEAIQSGIKLYDDGKYKEALKEFQQVKAGDTNYVWALYECALTCSADSQYAQGIRYCEQALALTTERERAPELLTQYGSLLDYDNQQERSLKIFDSAIALYPAYTTLYVNKGTTLLRMKKYKEAEKVFQQALLINPYSASSHYKLGLCAINQGQVVPAFLSMVANLVMEPEGRFSLNAIAILDNIAKSKDDVMEEVNKRKEEPNENFRMIEQIVLSKIALDKNYKSIIDLDDPISRQMQVVFEKLSFDETDNNFWMQYYVPFYKKMFDEKKFENLVYYAFSGIDIKTIKDYNKKNKKELSAFVDEVVAYSNLIRSTRELKYSKRNPNGPLYYFSSGVLVGKGIARNNGEILTGPWEFYYPAGNIKGSGGYNDKGEKEGPWKYYHFNGQLKGDESYRNGKQEGAETYYYDHGVVSSRAVYKNGEPHGPHTTYFKDGSTKMTANYSNGKLHGVKKTFNETGVLHAVETYDNGKQSGPFKTYHNNGQLESEGAYVDDKVNGPYKAWYNDGVLSLEAQYVQDKVNGVLKRYFENGKPNTVETYNNGTLEGEYVSYYYDGQLYTKYVNNKKGKVSGDVQYLDKDGKLYYTFTFDEDKLKAARYFDKAGKQISLSETSKGKIDLLVYNADGTKKVATPYNAKGEIDGIQTYFYGSGKNKEVNPYVKGELNGEAASYFSNGQKKAVAQYVANKKDGYYTSWFLHGGKEEEGWYKDNMVQGEWLLYNETGNLIARTNYLNGELNGLKTSYWPNGIKETEDFYEMGTLLETVSFDTTGKVLHRVKLPNGSGKFTSVYLNGKPYGEGTYINGNLDGVFRHYYIDGSVQAIQCFKKGLRDSIFRTYHYGGKISSEGVYKLNEKIGTWKYYRPDGSLSQTEEYTAGKLHGKKIYYYKNGKVDAEVTYERGDRHGMYKKYSEEGVLAYQLHYEFDLPVGYSYLGRNNEPVAEIPFLRGSGKINALFPNGNSSVTVEYVEGQQNGQYKRNHPSGKLCLENTEVYGNSEDLMKEYYPDGTLRSVYTYQHDNLHGPYKEYNAKGILVEEGNQYNGDYHGEQRFYDDNGKLKQVRVYYFGQLLSVK
ncbi:tetratricopeptide repeat protein [Niastella caeni]|uniref:Tetratricopeptide repeat protein n=1 Tax=Niastella caeni TaxID=2569763 RepID=A0A4S8HBI9_9BACT|nr:tetratricopeptide repeat protein [Niastella caeni]THU30774.1 tetratricopeptide repeat protein [Niastella caeni]